MAKGLAREVRRAVLADLKAKTAVTDLVPATNIHGQTTPKDTPWDFIKMGSFTSTPLKAPGCLDGAEVRCTVHAFAKSKFNADGAITKEAEDAIDEICKVIEETLDGAKLTTDSGIVKLTWINTIPLIDQGEKDAYHAVIDFRGRTLAP